MIRFQEVENEKSPSPSLLEPAPKRFLMNALRPLSAKQMTEMAVRSGKGY